MRSIWKGHIRFLLVAIPVRVYNAIETSEQIHLNQLHKDDYGPIGYDKRCKKCNKVVSKDDIIKGYQYSKDQYAILEPDDLAKVKLKTTKVIDIVPDGPSHLSIRGEYREDRTGSGVAGIGDFNGDGLADIGTVGLDKLVGPSRAYVIFGMSTPPYSLDLRRVGGDRPMPRSDVEE